MNFSKIIDAKKQLFQAYPGDKFDESLTILLNSRKPLTAHSETVVSSQATTRRMMSSGAFSFGVNMPEKRCLIEGCVSNRRITSGYCSLHYTRIKRHGNAFIYRPDDKPVDQRFWEKVNISENPKDCWEWQGALSESGYGQFSFSKKNKAEHWRAHRFAWFLTYKKVPSKSLLHSCDNRKCVNPNHLREGTHQDNMRDMVERNRQSKGEKVPSAKLTEADVLAIRKLSKAGLSTYKLAERFGVRQCVVQDVVSRKTWKHI